MESSRKTSGLSSLVITSNELDEMRRLVGVVGSGAGASAAESKDALLRATRKAASAARSAAWPNTLEGLRRRKVEERAARDVASEAAAVELDREAADARLMERLAVLRAANAYFEGQSDKVKALRNFRQRVADKESDTAATTLRKRREAALKGDEADFVAFQTAQKNAGDAIEAAKTASARVRAGEIAAGLTLQVRGVIQRRADDNAAEDARALLVKADSERLAGEERAALARKAAIIAAGKLKFAADNAMERAARANAADEGAALTIVVAAQVAQQEAQKALVKGILARQKAEREAHADIITGIVSALSDRQARAPSAEREAWRESAYRYRLRARCGVKPSIAIGARHQAVAVRKQNTKLRAPIGVCWHYAPR